MSAPARIQLPPKLIPVFSGKARTRGAYGGRGSAKTRSFAKMSAIWGYRLGKAGRTGVILCAREFMNSLDESSMEEVKAAIRSEAFLAAYYEVGEKYIRSRDGRIRYVFAGLRHNVDSIKSKAQILLCWVDEAENVREQSWAKLMPTVREEGSEVWVTWNPESKYSATHQRFRVDPDDNAKIIEMNWRDNPWFPGVLEDERQSDMRKRPDTYDWIWEGAFNLTGIGAYYAKEMTQVRKEGRIIDIEPMFGRPVHTAWDLGIKDETSIWWFQVVGAQIYILDFYTTNGVGIDHYARVIHEKPYQKGIDFVPHDARVAELGTGRTRIEVMQQEGLSPEVVPMMSIEDGRSAVRETLPLCVFHSRTEKHGVSALEAYRREWDDERKTYKPRAVHDWASHPADAFRYLAAAWQHAPIIEDTRKPIVFDNRIPVGPPEPRRSGGIKL